MKTLAWGVCAAAMTLTLARCGDSRSPSEGSPPPPAVVAGQWSGNFNINDHDTCFASNVPASATLQQQGAAVTGTFTIVPATCGEGTLDFDGVMSGNSMTGRVSAAGEVVSSRVTGSVSVTGLRVDLGKDRFGFPKGVFSLHR